MRGRLLTRVRTGVLAFAAAPLLSQIGASRLQLNETPDQVRRLMGQPALVADISPDFRSWQYRVGDIDHDSFSHSLVFRNSTNTLVSYSETFEKAVDVEKLFPAAGTTYHHYPAQGPVEMTVRLHRMPRNRLLLAIGSTGPGKGAEQLVLIDRSVLPLFYPWLAREL